MSKTLQRRHLEVLVAVDDSRSVHRASGLLGMPQPAVSRLLAEAESVLGLRMFDRSTHGSTPTAAAQPVLNHARFLLRGMERLHHLVLQSELDIRLGCIPRAMHTLMPRLLDLIYPAQPKSTRLASAEKFAYRFHVEEGTSVALFDTLTKGRLDFAILRTFGVGNVDKSLTVERLYDERLVVICASGNKMLPLTPQALGDLIRHDWVLPEVQTTSRFTLDQFCEAQGMPPIRPVIEARSFESNLALVAGTGLLSIAPESIARRHVSFGALRIIELQSALPSSPVMLAFHSRVLEDELLNGFRTLVHNVALC